MSLSLIAYPLKPTGNIWPVLKSVHSDSVTRSLQKYAWLVVFWPVLQRPSNLTLRQAPCIRSDKSSDLCSSVHPIWLRDKLLEGCPEILHHHVCCSLHNKSSFGSVFLVFKKHFMYFHRILSEKCNYFMQFRQSRFSSISPTLWCVTRKSNYIYKRRNISNVKKG